MIAHKQALVSTGLVTSDRPDIVLHDHHVVKAHGSWALLSLPPAELQLISRVPLPGPHRCSCGNSCNQQG